jgi:hypothetical protein
MVDASVFGTIQASGLILMGELGFRAETARITAVVTRNRRVAAACTQAGIAVYRRRRDLLGDYPPDDLSSLLGDEFRCHPASPWARWLARVDQTLSFAAWGAPPYAPPAQRSWPLSPPTWPSPWRSPPRSPRP